MFILVLKFVFLLMSKLILLLWENKTYFIYLYVVYFGGYIMETEKKMGSLQFVNILL